MSDTNHYNALLSALRMIPPDKRQWFIERGLKEIAEDERRGELKKRFDALPTDEMERALGVNRDTDPGPPPEASIDRIIAAKKKWRNPSSTE